jgi:hypothetical protein
VFWVSYSLHCRFLVTASNDERSSSSEFPNCSRVSATSSSPLSHPLSNHLLSTSRAITKCLAYNISARTTQKTVHLSIFTGHCLVTDVLWSLILRSMPSIRSICYSIFLPPLPQLMSCWQSNAEQACRQACEITTALLSCASRVPWDFQLRCWYISQAEKLLYWCVCVPTLMQRYTAWDLCLCCHVFVFFVGNWLRLHDGADNLSALFISVNSEVKWLEADDEK